MRSTVYKRINQMGFTYSNCKDGMCENIASLTSEKVPFTILL